MLLQQQKGEEQKEDAQRDKYRPELSCIRGTPYIPRDIPVQDPAIAIQDRAVAATHATLDGMEVRSSPVMRNNVVDAGPPAMRAIDPHGHVGTRWLR